MGCFHKERTIFNSTRNLQKPFSVSIEENIHELNNMILLDRRIELKRKKYFFIIIDPCIGRFFGSRVIFLLLMDCTLSFSSGTLWSFFIMVFGRRCINMIFELNWNFTMKCFIVIQYSYFQFSSFDSYLFEWLIRNYLSYDILWILFWHFQYFSFLWRL